MWRFQCVKALIEQVQMLLMPKVRKAIRDRSLQKALGATFTVWRNEDAIAAQRKIKGCPLIPGSGGDARHCTFVISFPLHTAVGPLQALYAYLKAETATKTQRRREAGKVRGKAVAAAIGKKPERIRADAEAMKKRGVSASRIVSRLAEKYELSERQIARHLSPRKPAPAWPDIDEIEQAGWSEVAMRIVQDLPER